MNTQKLKLALTFSNLSNLFANVASFIYIYIFSIIYLKQVKMIAKHIHANIIVSAFQGTTKQQRKRYTSRPELYISKIFQSFGRILRKCLHPKGQCLSCKLQIKIHQRSHITHGLYHRNKWINRNYSFKGTYSTLLIISIIYQNLMVSVQPAGFAHKFRV